MKKFFSVIIAAMLMLASFSACGTKTADNKNGKVKIVTTVFPAYDWVKNIVGENSENVEVTLLLDKGVDLHSYQPSAEDIMKISDCDAFVYVGGESDGWVEDALKKAENKNMKVINLMDTLGEAVKEEEHKEGMQETEHDHEHGGKEVNTFEDGEVKNRSLADWEGEWQSAYPLALDGSLDEAFEKKAKDSDKTAQEYKEYYQTGFKTDYDRIEIKGNAVSFTDNKGKTAKSNYKYVGYVIQDWSSGNRAALYRFEAEDKKAGTPAFIEFNDHMIEPEKAEHFHIRISDKSFDDIKDLETSWPTFYPAKLSPKEVCEELAGHGHGGEEEHDEHVWLSLKNAVKLCGAIADELSKIDEKNAEKYKNNVKAYVEKLSALDKKYEEVVSNGAKKTLVFGDRFPFRYLVDDYKLDYYAAFAGCSAETEASFETITFLSKKVDELSLNSILTIEGGDGKIAETVVNNTKDKNQKILTIDSMQGAVSDNASYLSIMESNLNVLKEALK